MLEIKNKMKKAVVLFNLGGPDKLESVENYLNIFKDYPYIFNLGHGVLPETKPETIEYIIQIVRNRT